MINFNNLLKKYDYRDGSIVFFNYQLKSILILSSLFFLSNVFFGICYDEYIYSILFFFLTMTSLFCHYYRNYLFNILDKIAILFVIIYGAYRLLIKFENTNFLTLSSILSSFFVVIYLYIYGFIYNKLCFDSNIHTANNYHFFLHLISCIGHNLIIFL